MARARSSVNCPREPVGLNRAEAARFVGVSEPLFDEQVAAGLMPYPHSMGSRLVWDADELLEAFKLLPRALPKGGKQPPHGGGTGEEIDFRT